MSTVLYVTQPGAFLHKTHGRLRVTAGKELLCDVRVEEVERVVLISGTVGLSGGAAACLLAAGIETAFLGTDGTFQGWLSPARGRGISLRLAQFAAYSHPGRRLALAQTIVMQKIRNADALLARFARNHPDFVAPEERARMANAIEAAQHASDVESLLGHEGIAAAAYFQAFGRMLRREFTFTVRSRRPPRDAANALLSFGYTLLTSEATGAIAGAGLDPALGMLHAPDDGRPSLGLDLTEEFRQASVDRLVLHLANNRVLSPTDDFEALGEENPFRLKPEARGKFLLAYEERMTEPFRRSENEPSTCLRTCIREQANRLAHAIRDGKAYRPFSLRQ